MQDSYLNFITMVRASLINEAFSFDGFSNIEEQLSLVEKHGLVLQVLPFAKESDIPEEFVKEWKKKAIKLRVHSDKVNRTTEDMCASLNEKDISCVGLKGLAAAYYYLNPDLRASGDIDILVKPNEVETAGQILLQDGFVEVPYEQPDSRNITYTKDNVILELHFCYVDSRHPVQEKKINDYLFSYFDSIELNKVGDYAIPMLPMEPNGIVLLYHVFFHLSGGIGLRQIIDWMMFVENSGLEDWTSFNAISKEAELFELQKVLTHMCEIYLGLPHRPAIDWCSDADEELCEQLMEYILECGNFGRGIEEDDASAKAKHFKGIIPAFQRLQKGGMKRWQAARKYAVLRPFAWMYQVGRLAKLSLKKKHPIHTFKGDMQKAHETEEMLKKLGVV